VTYSYDQESDILYVVFEQVKDDCDYVENQPGIVLRGDAKTQKVVGCTVLNFRARVRKSGRVEVEGLRGLELDSQLAKMLVA
jgi:uncharacterized protein YuzE